MSEKIDRLIEEISALRDSLDALYIVVEHLDRNKQEFIDLYIAALEKKPKIDPTQTSFCAECGTERPLEDVLREGWEQLTGGCPDCLEREDAQVEATRRPRAPEAQQEQAASQKSLFPDEA